MDYEGLRAANAAIEATYFANLGNATTYDAFGTTIVVGSRVVAVRRFKDASRVGIVLGTVTGIKKMVKVEGKLPSGETFEGWFDNNKVVSR